MIGKPEKVGQLENIKLLCSNFVEMTTKDLSIMIWSPIYKECYHMPGLRQVLGFIFRTHYWIFL